MISGCINISTRLQPEDTSVDATMLGEDCAYIILGFGFGRATVEQAKVNTLRFDKDGRVVRAGLPITKVRRVELKEFQLPFLGSRCVEVTGE